MFGLDRDFGGVETKNLLVSAFDDRGERFFTWFRSIEQCIEQEYAKLSAPVWSSQT